MSVCFYFVFFCCFFFLFYVRTSWFVVFRVRGEFLGIFCFILFRFFFPAKIELDEGDYQRVILPFYIPHRSVRFFVDVTACF